MWSLLLGLPFIGTFLKVIEPALVGIVEGVVEWAKAVWHGMKTSNYGTWTLVGTVAVLVYMFTPCPDCKCPTPKTSVTKSVVGKTSPSDNSSDMFLDWFRLH
jgi:hypothetical protein